MASTAATPGQVEFLIKKYPGGKFSGLLDDGISVGDELTITGPYGTSTLKDGHILPVICIAGGAGMAPVLALLRHMSETASPRAVRFYYGARTAAEAERAFGAARMRPDLGWRLLVGHVTDVVARHEGDIARSEIYLCGPPPMVDAALELLDTHAVPKDQVFYDKFTSPIFD